MQLAELTQREFKRADLWAWYDPRRWVRKELVEREQSPTTRGVIDRVWLIDFRYYNRLLTDGKNIQTRLR